MLTSKRFSFDLARFSYPTCLGLFFLLAFAAPVTAQVSVSLGDNSFPNSATSPVQNQAPRLISPSTRLSPMPASLPYQTAQPTTQTFPSIQISSRPKFERPSAVQPVTAGDGNLLPGQDYQGRVLTFQPQAVPASNASYLTPIASSPAPSRLLQPIFDDEEDSDDASKEGEAEEEDLPFTPTNFDILPDEPVEYPHETTPQWAKTIEYVPTLLSKPVETLGCRFGRIFHMEHDHFESALEEHAIGIQPIPERPKLLVELNEKFLAPGFLNQGIETKHGAVWRPSLWVFGEYRTAYQYFDRHRANDHVVEQVNRLDLFAQLNLTATERVLVGVRPLDEEQGGTRQFSGYDYRNGEYLDGWNARVQTLFFEGDFGEIFPMLDPYDSQALDFGFSIGRMPLLAQQGLLINEDMIDAVTVTRNTINGNGNLNLRTTGVFSWRGINRSSSTGQPNDFDPGSKLYAILTESDFVGQTVNVDGVYVDGDEAFGDMFAIGVSSIARHHLYENTYNTSLHLLASFPTGDRTAYADQGELLFSQLSWTPHHTEDLIYLNSFWAIDQYTSPAIGTGAGQIGILFSGIGLGSYAAPIEASFNNAVGTSLGYQFFFDHTRSQVIWELGAVQQTKGDALGTIGSGIRVQKAFGQHLIGILDGFVAKPEAQNFTQGARVELRVKF